MPVADLGDRTVLALGSGEVIFMSLALAHFLNHLITGKMAVDTAPAPIGYAYVSILECLCTPKPRAQWGRPFSLARHIHLSFT